MSRRKHQLDTAFRQAQQLHGLGRLTEAERIYRQILAAAPGHHASLDMLGVVALQSGQPKTALGLIDEAIRHSPSTAMYHVHRAHALLAVGEPADALQAAQTALRYKRNSAEAMLAMGHALSDLGRAEDAITAYRDAEHQNARLPDLSNSLGLAQREASRLEEAALTLQQGLRQSPADDVTRANLAGTLKDLGRLEEAEAIYRDLLRRHPDDPATHYNLGVLLLLAGRFEEAWPEWDWRFRADPSLTRPVPGTLWTGEPLQGRTLLIYAEQGIGDALQFCRYIPLIRDAGRILLEVHAPLVRLLSQLPGVSEVIAIGDEVPHYHLRCPMLSLPRALATHTEADIPARIPYLDPDPDEAARWRVRTEALPGLRVGIAWAGNPGRVRMDRRRSVNAAALAPLADIPGVSLVSLQKGEAGAALQGLPFAASVHDWTSDLSDFADTAALITNLDLVIAVDTAIVHLAGALGKPVWLLNRFDTCWRWLLGRDDSPWYPSLRQFRQSRPGDWAGVIENVCAALAQLTAGRNRLPSQGSLIEAAS
jgi:tetratricopeptide (TPR) repeat protein